jgi:hypothetical protein
MKFMIRTAAYSLLDYTRNEDILEELELDTVEKKFVGCKQKMVESY